MVSFLASLPKKKLLLPDPFLPTAVQCKHIKVHSQIRCLRVDTGKLGITNNIVTSAKGLHNCLISITSEALDDDLLDVHVRPQFRPGESSDFAVTGSHRPSSPSIESLDLPRRDAPTSTSSNRPAVLSQQHEQAEAAFAPRARSCIVQLCSKAFQIGGKRPRAAEKWRCLHAWA